jgi:Arc/MetJ family transcription regulator
MATNLGLDDDLIREAVRLGGHKTKREAVTRALEAYIERIRQRRVREIFGKMDFDPDYNHKPGRHR